MTTSKINTVITPTALQQMLMVGEHSDFTLPSRQQY